MTRPRIFLKASRDPVTGQTYIPPRDLAADGSLRVCEPVEVPAEGVLHSWTVFNAEAYGIVDLDCGARIQSYLSPGTERIGERCHAVEMVDEARGRARFAHE